MSRNNRSDTDFFFLIVLPFMFIPIIFMEDGSHPNLIEAMSANNAEEAINSGMLKKLSPYFAICQQENDITPGDARNTTLGQAEDTERCLFRKHEEAQAAPRP